MIRVSFSLFLSLSVFCYFTLLLIFMKIMYYFYYYYFFVFCFLFFHVPECSGMFHVPGFIDAQNGELEYCIYCCTTNKYSKLHKEQAFLKQA